jgi:hypothetical protein
VAFEMFKSEKNYLLLILLHVIIGLMVYYVPFTAKIYGYSMILAGLFWVIKNKNQDEEVLYVAAYIVGSEVFLRMNNGNPVYEFSKYAVIGFVLIGMYYKGFSKYGIPYWIFMGLLIPSIIVATQTLDYNSDIRKALSFNLSGPLCLGLASLYTYGRKVSLERLNDIMLMMALPVIACAVYLIRYTPSIRDVITGTGSNFETSGGFGPNQVSTMLGVGMFFFIARMIFNSRSKAIMLVNIIVALVIGYRGLITFSRGGMVTAALMLLVLFVITFFRVNSVGRVKMSAVGLLIAVALMGVWLYSSFETGGLIEKRYANQDASGRVKETAMTGREQISRSEFDAFLSHPVFGIGVGKGIELRAEETGKTILSHNEITRMLAEHGSFGIMGLLILFLTPMILYLDNKHHIYLICFVLFWLLTINHAAMRLAAPAFVYSLALLKIVGYEKPALHRK